MGIFTAPTTDKPLISTNAAVLHREGILTDEMLIEKTDEELKQLAIGPERSIRTESYKASMVKKKAEEQGHFAGEVYKGICRAAILLEQRKAKRIEEWKERNQEDHSALDALMSEAHKLFTYAK